MSMRTWFQPPVVRLFAFIALFSLADSCRAETSAPYCEYSAISTKYASIPFTELVDASITVLSSSATSLNDVIVIKRRRRAVSETNVSFVREEFTTLATVVDARPISASFNTMIGATTEDVKFILGSMSAADKAIYSGLYWRSAMDSLRSAVKSSQAASKAFSTDRNLFMTSTIVDGLKSWVYSQATGSGIVPGRAETPFSTITFETELEFRIDGLEWLPPAGYAGAELLTSTLARVKIAVDCADYPSYKTLSELEARIIQGSCIQYSRLYLFQRDFVVESTPWRTGSIQTAYSVSVDGGEYFECKDQACVTNIGLENAVLFDFGVTVGDLIISQSDNLNPQACSSMSSPPGRAESVPAKPAFWLDFGLIPGLPSEIIKTYSDGLSRRFYVRKRTLAMRKQAKVLKVRTNDLCTYRPVTSTAVNSDLPVVTSHEGIQLTEYIFYSTGGYMTQSLESFSILDKGSLLESRSLSAALSDFVLNINHRVVYGSDKTIVRFSFYHINQEVQSYAVCSHLKLHKKHYIAGQVPISDCPSEIGQCTLPDYKKSYYPVSYPTDGSKIPFNSENRTALVCNRESVECDFLTSLESFDGGRAQYRVNAPSYVVTGETCGNSTRYYCKNQTCQDSAIEDYEFYYDADGNGAICKGEDAMRQVSRSAQFNADISLEISSRPTGTEVEGMMQRYVGEKVRNSTEALREQIVAIDNRTSSISQVNGTAIGEAIAGAVDDALAKQEASILEQVRTMIATSIMALLHSSTHGPGSASFWSGLLDVAKVPIAVGEFAGRTFGQVLHIGEELAGIPSAAEEALEKLKTILVILVVVFCIGYAVKFLCVDRGIAARIRGAYNDRRNSTVNTAKISEDIELTRFVRFVRDSSVNPLVGKATPNPSEPGHSLVSAAVLLGVVSISTGIVVLKDKAAEEEPILDHAVRMDMQSRPQFRYAVVRGGYSLSDD